MAQTSHPSPIHNYNVLSLFIVAMILLASIASAGQGFSLELIHRDSPRSPLYPGNLTDLQRVQRLLQFSKSRALWLKNSIIGADMNHTTIRAPVQENSGMYMVAVRIGTRPGLRSLYLKLDTGSGLTWTQCDPCHPQFHQSDPMFKPTESPTFSHVPCGHRFCKEPFKCVNGTCWYVRYPHRDGNYVEGILSKDTFTFTSRSSGHVAVLGMVFGCTHVSRMNFHGQPAGIMGLGGSHPSFATQLIERTNGGFSYCLVKHDLAKSSFLRFGKDIPRSGTVQRTPILRLPDQRHHYLVLTDVSINNHRLHIEPGTFDRQHGGQGGVIIDTGLEFSRIVEPAYHRMRDAFVEYFHRAGLTAFSGQENGLHLDTCYHKPNNLRSLLPNMTFHFLSADLHVRWQELFWLGKLQKRPVFCLGIQNDESLTIIGAMQQHNTRFTYNIVNSELYFAPENCAHDAWNP